MSELTPCCYCSLQDLIRRYGKDNIRTQPSEDSRLFPIEVQRRKNGEWELIAGFGALTDHCVC
jgi:hypothetical protein